MSKQRSEVDWSEAGRISWETRRKHEEQADYKRRGKKASEKTRKPSEYGYVEELARILKIKKNHIFHHEGAPDLIAIMNDGKLRFYEIKPKKGSLRRQMLNLRQAKTIRELIKNEYVQEVNLVRYEKPRKSMKKPIFYHAPERLTRSNINKYTY